MYLQHYCKYVIFWHLNPQIFCQQIDKLLNMFFHRCSHTNSCFSELAYNSSVEIERKSLRFKKNVLILKTFLWILHFLFSLKLYPIQVVLSLPLWIKLTMDQILLLFLCNFCSLLRNAGGVPATNLFSLLLVDIFWLFSKP